MTLMTMKTSSTTSSIMTSRTETGRAAASPHVIEMRRIRPDPAVVAPQRRDLVHLGAGQFEVEDLEVLLDAGRGHRLRDHDVAELEVPAQHDLRRGLAVGLGDTRQHRLLQQF